MTPKNVCLSFKVPLCHYDALGGFQGYNFRLLRDTTANLLLCILWDTPAFFEMVMYYFDDDVERVGRV